MVHKGFKTLKHLQWFQSRWRRPQDVSEIGVSINHLLGIVPSIIYSEINVGDRYLLKVHGIVGQHGENAHALQAWRLDSVLLACEFGFWTSRT